MAEGNTFRLKIIAPERIFFDDDVNMDTASLLTYIRK